MSEPRYPTGISDPDQTARIPKDAIEDLRDEDKTQESGRSAPPAEGPRSRLDGRSSDSPGSGSGVSSRAPRPASGPPSRETGSGADQRSGPAHGRTPGVNGYPDGTAAARAPSRPAFGSGSAPGGRGTGSGSAYTGRSETGYSPSAYASPYTSAYPSLGEPPTSVTGAGYGGATAARSALGTATSRPPSRAATGTRPPRRARLLVRHVDPWSTLKFSFVVAVAMFFVWLVAVGVLYGVLDGMGVFSQVNGLYAEVSGNAGGRLFTPGLVLGTATLVGAVNIVLFTALATIGAFVYNICSDLVGGIEVTLAERD